MTAEADSARFSHRGEIYERVIAPVSRQWGEDLLELAALRPGERVLDVACGTGVVAHLAAPRVGAGGRVVGLDVTEGMLARARAQPAPPGATIEWRQADAADLPFPDGSFDVVCCQQGLQFVADRPRALREMRRVLVSGGRAALAVWSRIEGAELMAPAVARFVGADADTAGGDPLALADREALATLLDTAGFSHVEIRSHRRSARQVTMDDWIDYRLSGPLGRAVSRLSPDARAALIAEFRAALAPNVTPDGLVFFSEAHVVLVRN